MNKKVVIVTGVSRGLGLALFEGLLVAGFAVAGCSRTKSDEIGRLESQYSGDCIWFPCEIGDPDQESAFLQSVVAWVGDRRLYGLINNAGVAGDGVLATFPNIDSSHIVNVNLLGAMRLARGFLRATLASREPGRIINISSIVGLRGYTGLVPYSMSKAGMDGMTRALAREVGRRRITVNSIAPGYLRTDISASLNDKQRAQIVNRTPLGRLGEVSDVVPAAIFLMSDGAAFLTGHTLVIDGGVSC